MRINKHYTIKSQILSDHQVIDCYLTLSQLKKKSDVLLDVDGIYADGDKIFNTEITDKKINIVSLMNNEVISTILLGG